MTLRQSQAASRLRWTLSFGLFWVAILAGCERDNSVNTDTNRPPETFVTAGPLPSTDPLRPTLAFYRTLTELAAEWIAQEVKGALAESANE